MIRLNIYCLKIALLFLVFILPVLAQNVVVDPYANVDWKSFEQHKANLHTHTTQSDGELTPSQAIDEYRARGYTILALTEHNLCTWPWTELAALECKGKALQGDLAAAKEPDVPSSTRKFPQIYAYENREPKALGMVAIAGNEYSIHHHTNSFFVEHETRSRKLEQTIKEVGDLGGIMMINHPGRFWDLAEDGSIPDDVVEKYAAIFRDNKHVVGMEVINQGKRYKDDVRLWDKVLAVLMPEHPVWGFSNDDMHALKKLGRDWEIFLVPVLDEVNVRAAMESGSFYFSTLGTHPEEERTVAETPLITSITHDADAGTIAISATSGETILPDDQYKWISAGEVVHTGPVLDYRTTPGIAAYIRAELTGKGGTTYTNPYGIK